MFRVTVRLGLLLKSGLGFIFYI